MLIFFYLPVLSRIRFSRRYLGANQRNRRSPLPPSNGYMSDPRATLLIAQEKIKSPPTGFRSADLCLVILD
jgi:hypothetical protein